jgi:hypothetical protein
MRCRQDFNNWSIRDVTQEAGATKGKKPESFPSQVCPFEVVIKRCDLVLVDDPAPPMGTGRILLGEFPQKEGFGLLPLEVPDSYGSI